MTAKRKKNVYVINIELDKGDRIYDPYNNRALSNDLANYIDKQVNKSEYKDEIVINVITQEIDINSKSYLKSSIVKYYKDKVREVKVRETNYTLNNILVLLAGLICIVLNYGFGTQMIPIVKEVLNITGWFAIWEVIDTFLYVNLELKDAEVRAEQVSKATINIKN